MVLFSFLKVCICKYPFLGRLETFSGKKRTRTLSEVCRCKSISDGLKQPTEIKLQNNTRALRGNST